jgi:hypothetical protein
MHFGTILFSIVATKHDPPNPRHVAIRNDIETTQVHPALITRKMGRIPMCGTPNCILKVGGIVLASGRLLRQNYS